MLIITNRHLFLGAKLGKNTHSSVNWYAVCYTAANTKIYVCPQVVFCMDRILEQVPCTRFKLMKSECLAFLGRYQEAQEIAK